MCAAETKEIKNINENQWIKYCSTWQLPVKFVRTKISNCIDNVGSIFPYFSKSISIANKNQSDGLLALRDFFDHSMTNIEFFATYFPEVISLKKTHSVNLIRPK